MPKQIVLYNLRDDVKDEDYIKWCHEFIGPLLLGLNSTRSLTVLKMVGGRKWNGQRGETPQETKAPFKFIGIVDVTSKEEWMKDVASEAYQKDFFPKFFSKWGADSYAILGDEVYYGQSDQ